MRKILTLCLVALMAFTLAFVVGCSGNDGPKTLTLNNSQLTLYVGDEYLLEVNENVDAQWSSNNEAVVYVSGSGVINALKAGQATITASANGAVGSCVVTVLDDVQFSLKKTQINMAQGDNIVIASNVVRKVNGIDSTQGTLSATSSNPDVAEIVGGTISLKSNGNATITIVWNYNGTDYTQTLSVTVENKVFLVVDEPSEEIYAYGENTTLQLEASLEVNRQDISNPQLVWESSNQDVATVDQNGLVTGVTFGTATITAKYTYDNETYTDTVEINVERATVPGTKTYKFGYKNQNAILSADDYIGAVQGVSFEGAELVIEKDSATGAVTVLGSNFSQVGEVTVDVLTDKVQTTATFDLVTAILMTAEDLDKMDEYCRPEDWDFELMKTTNLYGYGGTILLGADIDYGGKAFETEVYFGSAPYTSGHGGVYKNLIFDGQGYAISNISIVNANNCLFGYRVAGESVIKNLAILNVTLSDGSVITNQLQGSTSIENVFVRIKSTVANGTFANGLVGSVEATPSANIKNVVIDVFDAVNADHFAGIVRTSVASPRLNMFSAVYTLGATVNVGAKDGTNLIKVADNNTGYVGGAYETDAEFLSAKDGVFTGSFANSFAIESVNGVQVLKFMGRIVKTFLTNADDALHYSFGYKNQDLIIPASDFDGEVTKIEILNWADLTFKKVDSNYVIDKAGFNSTGTAKLKISTATNDYFKNVEVITAVLMTAEDLDNMDVWGRPANFDADKLGTSGVMYNYSGIFRLGADIDYGGKLYTTEVHYGMQGYVSGAGARWKGLVFDGQGNSIKNIKFDNALAENKFNSFGLFGYEVQSSTIKNVAVTGVEIGSGAYTGVFGRIIKTNSVLENVFVQGSSNSENNHAFTFYNLADATCRINNVVVDVVSVENSDKLSAITVVGQTATDRVATITNAYVIGAEKTVCYNNSDKTATVNMENALAGYIDDQAFLAAKDTIFTSNFTVVFTIETENGNTVLKFFDKTVKTFENN